MEMHKRSCLVLALIAVFGVASGIQAQEPEETIWQFTFNETNVIAYSLDGTVNVLQTGEYELASRCVQVGPETALFQAYGQPGLQRLTPDTMELMTLMPGANEVELGTFLGVSPARNYLVIGLRSTVTNKGIEGLLVNMETGVVERLTGPVGWTQLRFSEDERFLRYGIYTDAGNELRERELGTGTERIIFSGLAYPVDHYGENWLTPDLDQNTGIMTYRLISMSGDVEEIAVFHRDNPNYPEEDGLIILPLEDKALITFKMLCGGDCRFELQPLDGGDPMMFIGPETAEDTRAFPLKWVDETHLLVRLSRDDSLSTPDIWLLGSDGSAEALGFSLEPVMITFPSLPHARWYVVSDRVVDSSQRTGIHYRVWDSLTSKYVLEGTFDATSTFGFGETGFIVLDTGATRSSGLFYRAADGEVFRLPKQPDGFYSWEILAGDTILYKQASNKQASMEPGLYLYDPVAESYSLLVAGTGWLPCDKLAPSLQ